MVIYNSTLYRFYETVSCSLIAHFSNEWKFLKSEFDCFFPTPLLPKMLNKSIILARMSFCHIWGGHFVTFGMSFCHIWDVILSHLGCHFVTPVTFVKCKKSSSFDIYLIIMVLIFSIIVNEQSEQK